MKHNDFKSKKQLYAWLKVLADDLPLQGYKTREKHLTPGYEANEVTAGTDGNPFGDRYNPDGLYIEKFPVINTVNHFNRLKTAYKDNGRQGVSDYIENIKKQIQDAEFQNTNS